MIQSMTGYAVQTRDLGHGNFQLEIKSVNSRYLDMHFRIGEDWRAAELPLRELITSRVSRGKVECRLNFNAAAARSDQLNLNADLLAAVRGLDAQVRAEMPEARPGTRPDRARCWRGPAPFAERSRGGKRTKRGECQYRGITLSLCYAVSAVTWQPSWLPWRPCQPGSTYRECCSTPSAGPSPACTSAAGRSCSG